MSHPVLIIDGYNLMHAAGMARQQYGPGDLENCRNEFINFLLLALREQQLHRTTVVFDAFNAPENTTRRFSLHGLSVLFAEAGSDADSAIEQLIQQHSAPRSILVVSSDHRIQRAAKKRRAAFSDSDQFLHQLEQQLQRERQREGSNLPQKYGHGITPLETEYWLKEFGTIPLTAQDSSEEKQPSTNKHLKQKKSDSDSAEPIKPENTEADNQQKWLDIFGDFVIDTENLVDDEFWQQQIDQIIDDEKNSP